MVQHRPQPVTVLAMRLSPIVDSEQVGLVGKVQGQLLELACQLGGADQVLVGNSATLLFRGSDHQAKAVQAAQELKGFMRSLNQRLCTETGRLLTLHQGISSGQVFEQALLNLIGRPLDEALLIKDLAGPGQILVTGPVHQAVRAQYLLEDLPFASPSLDSPPMNLYRVLDQRETPLDPAAPDYQVDTALRVFLVGRNTELALLQQRLSALIDRQGGFACIEGAAGLGKSRLLAELRKWAAGRGWLYEADPFLVGGTRRILWLETRGLPFHSGRDGGRPGILLIPLVLGCLRLTDSPQMPLMGESGWDRLCEAIQQRWPDKIADLAPYLAHLLGLPVQDKVNSDRLRCLGAAALWDRIGRALRFLLERTASQWPMVIIMDDLHWADRLSLALLGDLVPTCSQIPVLWVATTVARGDEHPAFRLLRQIRAKLPSSYCLNLELTPLMNGESTCLVQNLLQNYSLPDGYLKRVHRRAGGNPFVIEETLRYLIGQRALALLDGRWQAPQPSSSQVQVSTATGSVEVLLQQRLAQLPGAVQATAQVAAAVGRFFTLPVLSRLLPYSSDELDAHLEALEGVSIIRARGDGEYTFHHILTQDAIYRLLSPQKVRTLHAQVGDVYGQIFADTPAEGYDLLAYHYGLSDQPAKGFEYARLAAQKNRSQSRYWAARRYFAQAQVLAEQLGDEPGAIDMVMAQADVQHQLGNRPAAIAGYRVALERAKALQDTERQIRANQSLAHTMYLQRDRTSTLGFARRAHDLARSTRPEDSWAGSWMHMGWAHQVRGEYAEAIHHFEQAFAQADAAGDVPGRAASRENLGGIYRLLGHGERALVQYRGMLHWARQADDRRLELLALFNLANAYLLIGQADEAEAAVQESIKIAKLIGWVNLSEPLLQLARVQLAHGQLSDAWGAAGQARQMAEQAGRSEVLGLIQRLQGELVMAAQLAGEKLPGADQPAIYFHASLQTLRAIQELEWARTLQIYGQFLASNDQQAEGDRYLALSAGVFGRLGVEQLMRDLAVD